MPEQKIIHNDVEATERIDSFLHQRSQLVRIVKIGRVTNDSLDRRKVLHDTAVARIGGHDRRPMLDQCSGNGLTDAVGCVENQCIKSVKAQRITHGISSG